MTKTFNVPLMGNLRKSVTVNPSATEGAQIGVNLMLPDGSVGTVAQLQALFGNPATGGSTITTTDDLDEGQWNLYFTALRAQDAVGAILTDTGTISFDYVSGTTIAATLKDLADDGTGTLLAINRDIKGRAAGTRAVTAADLAPALDSSFFGDILQTETGAGLLTESGDFLTVD